MIFSRFGVSDVPDAFLYMPEQLGGLGLRNPFVAFFLVKEMITKDPKDVMQKFREEERERYEIAKKEFEEQSRYERRKRFRLTFPGGFSDKTPQPNEQDTFMSFEEYSNVRESTSRSLQRTYMKLLSTPVDDRLFTHPDVARELTELQWSLPELKNLSAEKKWIVDLHAAELFETCGGLSMVEKSFLPLGVLTMMRAKKVTWQMVL